MGTLNLALILTADNSQCPQQKPTISDTKTREKQFYLGKLFPVQCNRQYLHRYPHNRDSVNLITIFYLVINYKAIFYGSQFCQESGSTKIPVRKRGMEWVLTPWKQTTALTFSAPSSQILLRNSPGCLGHQGGGPPCPPCHPRGCTRLWGLICAPSLLRGGPCNGGESLSTEEDSIPWYCRLVALLVTLTTERAGTHTASWNKAWRPYRWVCETSILFCFAIFRTVGYPTPLCVLLECGLYFGHTVSSF